MSQTLRQRLALQLAVHGRAFRKLMRKPLPSHEPTVDELRRKGAV